MEGYKIGDRLQIGEHICTIRYIGTIAVWKDELTFGVEWDDPERGKHSGTLQGVKYFSTIKENAGSFVKYSKVTKTARLGFFDVIENVYGTPAEMDNEVQISSKNIEFLGFELLNDRNQQFNSLKIISLEKRSIYYTIHRSETMSTNFRKFNNLNSLNISYNLFSDFESVLQLLHMTPNLSTLNISGNKFRPDSFTSCEKTRFNNIKQLSVANCNLSIEDTKHILEHFPCLETLDISHNALSQLAVVPFDLPASLNKLLLTDNSLEALPQGYFHWNINSLDLSSNKIRWVDMSLCEENGYKPSLIVSLDLSYNEIEDWDVVDNLNELFPNLKSLRINGNPILVETPSENCKESVENNGVLFLNTLARFNDLDILDGSQLTVDIKNESELHFISELCSRNLTLSKDRTRWAYFENKYSLTQKISKYLGISREHDTLTRGLEVLRLNIQFHDKTNIPINILPNITIRYMKSIISRQIGISNEKFKILYEPTKDKDSRVEICRNFSLVSDLGMTDGSDIYVVLY